jgi:phenylpropionate dioxygenase-like ring-hydroxylating dioxygenase large terminal subunit
LLFVRNTWYAAAWSEEVGAAPFRRTILDEAIVFYRPSGGEVVALVDRCPHRLVPLSLGAIVDGALQCGYHGLRFDASGSCIHNPHGDGTIPPGARVRKYPLAERDGIVWIWMGEPGREDSVAIPVFPAFGDDRRFALAAGHIRVAANFQLVTDNLLDLSHVEFLHSALRTHGTIRQKHEVRQDGDTVWSMGWRYGALPNVPMQRFWPADKPGDTHAHMRWDPPGLMLLDVGMGECGSPDTEARSRLSAHLLTPETHTSTHYFWAFRCETDSPEEIAAARALGIGVFAKEDAPVIECQQANLGPGDLAELERGLLASDSAAIRARRVLARLLAREHEHQLEHA